MRQDRQTYQTLRHRIQWICILCLFVVSAHAQKTAKQELIYLEHAESLLFDKDQSSDYQVLVGNVQFRHDSVWMYCDTAHYYQADNSLFAFGHVHITQGDTLTIDGKTLFYDGNRKLAQMRQEVVMANQGVTLYTDHLDYDRIENIGYYFMGGKIVDTTNVLTSVYGRYNPATKMAFFKEDVVLTHPQFVLTTDTLNYNTDTRVASIVSHSIITSDQSVVHAFRGWYNTLSGESLLLDRSYVESSPNYMIGDTVRFNQNTGIGQAWGHVLLTDSSQSVHILGNYGRYVQDKEETFITGQALLKEFSGRDTLYLHADTLKTRKDSIFDTFMAYHHVRCYRVDLQALCDSIFFSTRDSVLNMSGSPIIWSDNQQVRGTLMKLYIKNGAPDYLYVQRDASIVSQEEADSSYFNQSTGDELTAWFKNNKVYHIVIVGNANAIYIPHNDKNEMIGLVRLEHGDMSMFMDEEGKMQSVTVSPEPVGKFYPLSLVTADVKHLPLFSWPIQLRPTHPEDVFRHTGQEGGSQETRRASTPRRSNRERAARGRSR